MSSVFSMHDPSQLAELLREAGFSDGHIPVEQPMALASGVRA